MKKLFSMILVLGLLLGGNAYANVKVLECKQIIEINEDIGEDLIIKHIVKISFLQQISVENSELCVKNAIQTSISIINKEK